MSAYRLEMTVDHYCLDFAVKIFTSHRDIPPEQKTLIEEEFRDYESKTMNKKRNL